MTHDDDGTVCVLASKRDVFNFTSGVPMYMTKSGQFLPMTKMQLARSRMLRFWHLRTRWFRMRTVVSAVDHAVGTVTLSDEHWSWRHWRWERS